MKILTFSVCAVLFFSTVASAAERTWTSDKSITEIISSLQDDIVALQDEKYFDRIDSQYADFLRDTDLEIRTLGRTKERTYQLDVKLLSSKGKITKFNKSVYVKGSGNQTIIQSKIEIEYGKKHRFPFRWIDKIKDCVIFKLENKVLDFEEFKFKQFTTEKKED